MNMKKFIKLFIMHLMMHILLHILGLSVNVIWIMSLVLIVVDVIFNLRKRKKK